MTMLDLLTDLFWIADPDIRFHVLLLIGIVGMGMSGQFLWRKICE